MRPARLLWQRPLGMALLLLGWTAFCPAAAPFERWPGVAAAEAGRFQSEWRPVSGPATWRTGSPAAAAITATTDLASESPVPVSSQQRSDPAAPRFKLPASASGGAGIATPVWDDVSHVDLGRLAAATGVTAVLAMTGLVGLRHWRDRRTTSGARNSLSLCGTVWLGARNGVHLVGVQDRHYLIAVDARGVSSVTPVGTATEEGELSSGESPLAEWPAHLFPLAGG